MCCIITRPISGGLLGQNSPHICRGRRKVKLYLFVSTNFQNMHVNGLLPFVFRIVPVSVRWSQWNIMQLSHPNRFKITMVSQVFERIRVKVRHEHVCSVFAPHHLRLLRTTVEGINRGQTRYSMCPL